MQDTRLASFSWMLFELSARSLSSFFLSGGRALSLSVEDGGVLAVPPERDNNIQGKFSLKIVMNLFLDSSNSLLGNGALVVLPFTGQL